MKYAIDVDIERHRVDQIILRLYHSILKDYIARANEREVLDALYKFYTESDVTFISKKQLEVYKKMEELTLSGSFLKTNDGILPKE